MNGEQRKKLMIKDLKAILAENVLIFKEKENVAQLDIEEDEIFEYLYEGKLYEVPQWLLDKSIRMMYPAKEHLTEIMVD